MKRDPIEVKTPNRIRRKGTRYIRKVYLPKLTGAVTLIETGFTNPGSGKIKLVGKKTPKRRATKKAKRIPLPDIFSALPQCYLGKVDWVDASRMKPGVPMQCDGYTITKAPRRATPVWTYSTYRAILRRDGTNFAIVSPDGRNALAPEQVKLLLDALNKSDPKHSHHNLSPAEVQAAAKGAY